MVNWWAIRLLWTDERCPYCELMSDSVTVNWLLVPLLWTDEQFRYCGQTNASITVNWWATSLLWTAERFHYCELVGDSMTVNIWGNPFFCQLNNNSITVNGMSDSITVKLWAIPIPWTAERFNFQSLDFCTCRLRKGEGLKRNYISKGPADIS
jgi:hypothetical protein